MEFRPTMRKTRNQIARAGVPVLIKQNENILHPSKKDISTTDMKLLPKDSSKNALGLGLHKRKNENENCEDQKVSKKRAAFGDITNAIEKSFNKTRKVELGKGQIVKSQISKVQVLSKSKSTTNLLTKATTTTKTKVILKNKENVSARLPPVITEENEKPDTVAQDDSVNDSLIILSQELKINKLEDSASYITASEGSPVIQCASTSITDLSKTNTDLPLGVEDFDAASCNDFYAVSPYAMTIFRYYKEREAKFPVQTHKFDRQQDITKFMRAVLVDWMVEVQESFELNHETLYLAVKLVDLYLTKVVTKRDKLQLVGSTAIFIACKFDERTPPYIDDFLYICDDAYKRKELIAMEINMLKQLGFDLGIPLSYRFLRRYARCGKVSLETLTFARFMLEMSLMDYDFVGVSDSILACAALFLALNIKENIKEWSPTLAYFSGYEMEDFYHYVKCLHQMLLQPPKEHLKTIRNKYSHTLFFEVAKIKIPENVLD